jgi:hypothetical protein
MMGVGDKSLLATIKPPPEKGNERIHEIVLAQICIRV